MSNNLIQIKSGVLDAKVNPKGMGLTTMMEDIFSGEKVYGNSYVMVGEPRKFNAAELAHLNTAVPAVVFQGQYSLACKLFVKGSSVCFLCKNLDTMSVATVGQMFDITKCYVTKWQRPGESEIKIKILVPVEAIVG